MTVVLVPIMLVLVVVAVGLVLVKRFGSNAVEQSDRLQDPDRPTLRYLVPAGQDPAVVLGALRNAGYDASPDSEPGPSSPIVIVGSPAGEPIDRERVRATLGELDQVNVNPEESAPLDLPPVRFVDEG
jgi:hypothetical protein